MTPDDEHYIGYTFTDVARLMRTVFERRVREFGPDPGAMDGDRADASPPGLEPIRRRRHPGDREGFRWPADRPNGGQGLAAASRRCQRPARQSSAPDPRRRAPARRHLAACGSHGRHRARRSVARRAAPAGEAHDARERQAAGTCAEHDPEANPGRGEDYPTTRRRARCERASEPPLAAADPARRHSRPGGARRAAVLAVGRALRHDRERLRQGAHRPDLGGDRRPHARRCTCTTTPR